MSIKLRQLFDEQAEIMAWVVLALAVAGRLFDKLDDGWSVAMVGMSLVTMLGVSRFRGLSVGPSGFTVGNDGGAP